MNVFDLFAKISLDTQGFSSGLNTVVSGAKKLSGAVGVAIGAATTATVAFGKQSVAVGQTFDQSMSRVAATMGVTVDEIGELRQFALDMGRTSVFSATQAAEALNYMALAGYDAEKSMAMLPNVLDLAASGGMNLALASDMITDAQSALGLSMDDTTELVNKMAKAASSSNTSVSQLGEAILQIGGTAKKLKGSTTELTTILGILADNGMKGAEGGTHLRNMLNSLISPSKEAGEMMADLGISLYDAEGNMRSLDDVFVDLRESMNALTTQAERDQVVSTLFNARDMKAAEALLAGVGDRYAELSGKIDAAAGAAKDMAGTQLQNLSGDITLFKSALEGAQIVVSDKLTPTIRQFVQFGTNGLQKLTDAFAKDGLAGAMGAFGDVLSEGLSQVIEFIPKAIEAGANLLDALITGLENNSDLIFESLERIFSVVIEQTIRIAPKLIVGFGKLIKAIIKGLVGNTSTVAVAFVDLIKDIAGMMGDANVLDDFAENAFKIIDAIADGISSAVPVLLEAATRIILRIVAKLVDPQNITRLLQAGIKILIAFVDGIKQAIPQLLAYAPVILQNLASSFSASVDILISGAKTIISTIVTNLPKIISELLEAVPDIIGNITGKFDDNSGDFVTDFAALVKKIALEWPTIIAGFIDKIADIVDKIGSALKDPENVERLKEASVALVSSLADLATTIIMPFVDAVPDMIEELAKALTNEDTVGRLSEALGETIGKLVEQLPSILATAFRTVSNMFANFFAAIWNNAIDAGAEKLRKFGLPVNDLFPKIEYGDFFGSDYSAESSAKARGRMTEEDFVKMISQNPYSMTAPLPPQQLLIELEIDGQKFGKITYDLSERERQRRGATVLDRITVND